MKVFLIVFLILLGCTTTKKEFKKKPDKKCKYLSLSKKIERCVKSYVLIDLPSDKALALCKKIYKERK